MNAVVRPVANRPFRGDINTSCKSRRMAFLMALLLAGVGSLLLGTAPEAKAQSITLAKLAGPWQIALVGNTGCGVIHAVQRNHEHGRYCCGHSLRQQHRMPIG